MIPNSSVNKLAVSKLVVSYENVALLTFILVREWSFIDDYFVPKAESRVYSSPIASNKSAGTFAGTLKIEKM